MDSYKNLGRLLNTPNLDNRFVLRQAGRGTSLRGGQEDRRFVQAQDPGVTLLHPKAATHLPQSRSSASSF